MNELPSFSQNQFYDTITDASNALGNDLEQRTANTAFIFGGGCAVGAVLGGGWNLGAGAVPGCMIGVSIASLLAGITGVQQAGVADVTTITSGIASVFSNDPTDQRYTIADLQAGDLAGDLASYVVHIPGGKAKIILPIDPDSLTVTPLSLTYDTIPQTQNVSVMADYTYFNQLRNPSQYNVGRFTYTINPTNIAQVSYFPTIDGYKITKTSIGSGIITFGFYATGKDLGVQLNISDAVSQSCTYSINPTSQSFTSTGGSGSISVTVASGCNWNATSNVSWITITSGSSGSGNGTVNFSVATNIGASCLAGTITVAGNTFNVTQIGTIGSCGLVNSVWPKFHGNMQNTGLSTVNTSADSGSLQWTYTTGNYVDSSPAIGVDGTIYIDSDDHNLYAISSTGALKWSYTTGGFNTPTVESSPAIGVDGTIYVGSQDDNLYAINPNGSLKWKYPTGNGVYSSPAIGADGTIYVGSYDNNLYALNPNGTLKWSYTTGGAVTSSPAIGADGTIYVGSADGNLYALNPDGSLKWTFTTGYSPTTSPAIGVDGTIYAVGTYNHNLYAISPTGGLLWTYLVDNNIYSSPAIGADGTIYISSYYGYLFAINASGGLKWSYTTYGSNLSSPAIGADGTIYIGLEFNGLYAINPNGTYKWSYSTGPAGSDSSPAIGADGTVYIGSQDHNLYAIH